MVLSVLKRIVGFDLLADLSEFFTAFSGMIDGFRDRAHRVNRLLTDDQTCFIVVCGPQGQTIEEAVFFRSKLAENGMHFGGVVVNRVRYRHGRKPPGLRALTGQLEEALGGGSGDLPERLARNLIEYDVLAQRDAGNIARLTGDLDENPVIRIPYLDTDVHDLTGLTEIDRYLFADEETRTALATGRDA